MDPADTGGYDYNEECFLLEQACPDKSPWSDSHEKFEYKDVICSHCGKAFDVKGLDW